MRDSVSADEKTLDVTGRIGGAPVAPAGGAGGSIIVYTTIDSQRVYSTGGVGVQVIGSDGKFLGEIPAPLNLITVVFSGPDKKTLYGVANNQQFDEIFAIPMIAQGYTGRAK